MENIAADLREWMRRSLPPRHASGTVPLDRGTRAGIRRRPVAVDPVRSREPGPPGSPRSRPAERSHRIHWHVHGTVRRRLRRRRVRTHRPQDRGLRPFHGSRGTRPPRVHDVGPSPVQQQSADDHSRVQPAVRGVPATGKLSGEPRFGMPVSGPCAPCLFRTLCRIPTCPLLQRVPKSNVNLPNGPNRHASELSAPSPTDLKAPPSA